MGKPRQARVLGAPAHDPEKPVATDGCFMTASPDIPDTMRAVVLTGHGDLDKLQFHDAWPTPVPGPGEVLIRVHACGLNNTDVNTRTAWYSKAVSDRTTGGAFRHGRR